MNFVDRFPAFRHGRLLARPNSAPWSPARPLRRTESRRGRSSLSGLTCRPGRKPCPPATLPRRAQTGPPWLARVSLASCPSPPPNYTTHPAVALGQHLEIIQLLRDFRLGNAIQKLAHPRLPAGAHLLWRTGRHNLPLVDQHHPIGN